jgi:hypothetical protein
MGKIHQYYLLLMLAGMVVASPRLRADDVRSNPTPQECDSIYLSNGKAYAVKNLVLMEKEISFQFCEDLENRPQTAPWQRIDHIKKVDGTLIDSPFKKKTPPSLLEKKETQVFSEKKVADFHPTPEELEKKIKNLFLIALLSPFLFGITTILIVYPLAKKYHNALPGHPKEQQLRKKLEWATWLSILLPLSFMLLLILLMILFPTQIITFFLSIFFFIIGYK